MTWESKWPMTNSAVGYRRPPASARFKPGQSGNPKGRPKRSKNGRTMLMQALNETVVVTEAGIEQRMTKREAFFKTLVARALKDNRFATLLMRTMEQYDLNKDHQDSNVMRIVLVSPKDRDQ